MEDVKKQPESENKEEFEKPEVITYLESEIMEAQATECTGMYTCKLGFKD